MITFIIINLSPFMKQLVLLFNFHVSILTSA